MASLLLSFHLQPWRAAALLNCYCVCCSLQLCSLVRVGGAVKLLGPPNMPTTVHTGAVAPAGCCQASNEERRSDSGAWVVRRAPQVEAVGGGTLRSFILAAPPAVPPPGKWSRLVPQGHEHAFPRSRPPDRLTACTALAGESDAAVASLPSTVTSLVASGDATGGGSLLFRVFQNEWGGRATLAVLDALNTLVRTTGCGWEAKAAFAGVRDSNCCSYCMTMLEAAGVTTRPVPLLHALCPADAFRRAVERGVQTAIPSALRAVQTDVAPLAVCLLDAVSQPERP